MFTSEMRAVERAIKKGKRVSIIGLRGVGKSTFLDILSTKSWLKNAIIIKPYANTKVANDLLPGAKILLDDAHKMSSNLIEMSTIFTSLIELESESVEREIVYLRPLSKDDIKKLLDELGVTYDKDVPDLIFRRTGGFLSYISIMLGYIIHIDPRIYLSNVLVNKIASNSHVIRLARRLALEYLEDYVKYFGKNFLDDLRTMLNGEFPPRVDRYIKLGFVVENNGGIEIRDPFIKDTFLDRKKVDAKKIAVRNIGFTRFYPLDDSSFYIVYDKYIIAALDGNILEKMMKIKQVANILFCKGIFVITPENVDKKPKNVKIFHVSKEEFKSDIRKKIYEVISLIDRVYEISNI